MSTSAPNHRREALDVEACTRAWCALRAAHARVTECLATSLAETCGIGVSDFEVLLFLRDAEPMPGRINDLGAAVSLSQPALSRLVARLVERGLIERARASDDQRAVRVALTDAGRELLCRAIPLQAACVHDHLVGRVSEAEREALIAILGRMR